MPDLTQAAIPRGFRFVRQGAAMRLLGFSSGSLALAASLHATGSLGTWWPLLLATALGWPWLAWRLTESKPAPLKLERRNLLVDGLIAGMWIGIIGLDLMPSTMLVSALVMDRTMIGGWRMMWATLLAILAACLVALLFTGFVIEPHTTLVTMLWCLPFMALYPLALGALAHFSSDKVRAQNRLLERVVRIDPETGLATRQQWLAEVAERLQRFHRHGAVSSLLMIDIDEFKKVNDTYGHLAGDEAIRQVSRQLHDGLRSVDLAGRYGGDEFGVLLPGTDGHAAMEVAERLRLRVANQVAVGGTPVTLSIGVAELRPGMEGIGDWAGAADEALYRAKAEGRNRVCSVGDEPVSVAG